MDTTFSENSGRIGGAVLSGTNLTTTIDNVRFLSNSALNTATNSFGGGGLYLSSFQTLPLTTRFNDAVITNSTFQGNNTDSAGGGLRFSRTSSVDIQTSSFSNNLANGGDGGGIRATNSLSLNLDRSTLSDNSAYVDGGGLSFVNVYDTSVQNATISGNRAANDGGGIWASFDSYYNQTFDLNFSTITGNRSDDDMNGGSGGGGLLTTLGYADIRNSIISGNSDGSGVAPDFAEQVLANVTYSLVEDPLGNSVTNGVSGNIVGVSAMLGGLANNGGPTLTHLPMPGSPVINAADPAATLAEDQRGYSRPGANSSRDMGAVETDGVSPTLNLDFNNDGLYNCSDMDLLEAAIDGGTYNAAFDVNGDLVLNSNDVFAWLTDAGELRFGTGRPFLPGDANLSGGVDGSDFGIWNANKFTSASNWCQGDFNQNGTVDGSDFGIWNANKFQASDGAGRGAAEAGPAAPLAQRRAAEDTSLDELDTDSEAAESQSWRHAEHRLQSGERGRSDITGVVLAKANAVDAVFAATNPLQFGTPQPSVQTSAVSLAPTSMRPVTQPSRFATSGTMTTDRSRDEELFGLFGE